MYRRSTVNQNSDTSTKWDYSDEWQTFTMEVADSFSGIFNFDGIQGECTLI